MTAFYSTACAYAFRVQMAIRPVWLDEVWTYYQVAGRSAADFIASFSSGVNAMPYIYFVFPWIIGQFTELDPLALRLPSLLFAVGALLVTHGILRAQFGHVIAWAGVVSALVLSGEWRMYVAEARPYALYVLAAAIHLGVTHRLTVGPLDKRVWVWHAFAAFLLPSVHFTGGIYSIALLGVYVLSSPSPWSRKRLGVASFLCGWGVALLLHLNLMRRVIATGDWIVRPSFNEALTLLDRLGTVHPVVPTACLALLVAGEAVRGFFDSGAPSEERLIRLPERELFASFYVWACVAWLCVPVALTAAAATGLPNMHQSRYLLPSMLAGAILVCFLLTIFRSGLSVATGGPSQDAAGSRRFPVLNGIVIAVFLVALSKWVLADAQMMAAYRADGVTRFRERFGIPENPGKPIFITVPHAYFPAHYHDHGNPDLRFLVADEAKRKQWARFAPEIALAVPEDLLSVESAYLITDTKNWLALLHDPPRKGPTYIETHGILVGNHLTDWLARHGFEVEDTGTFSEMVRFAIRPVRDQ